jgi:hypothetical protein
LALNSRRLTNTRRCEYFISARNQHVKRQLLTNYDAQTRIRKIDVFCVSNSLYREGNEEMTKIARRTSGNVVEKTAAAQQVLSSSCIRELRDFCQGIPSRSQIMETKHFLNTRLIALFEKTELWLNASVAGVAANRQAPPAYLTELQAELKMVSSPKFQSDFNSP